MKPMLYVGVICGVITIIFLALTTEVLRAPEAKPCTRAWFQYLDEHYTIHNFFDADDDGQGPDLGDREWLYGFTVMIKIKVPEELSDPERCQFVQKTLRERIYIVNKAFGWVFIWKVH
jgi:hypothetical protein